MQTFDENKCIEEYCSKMKCHICEGTNINGEPNGYGCSACQNYVEKRYNAMKDMNCNQAEKSGNLCLGYSRSENDDEPCKQCLECHQCTQGYFQLKKSNNRDKEQTK